MNCPRETLRVLVVTVVNLDADPAIGSDTGPVDVEHVGVGLSDCLLDQVPVLHIDLLFQSLGFPNILCDRAINKSLGFYLKPPEL